MRWHDYKNLCKKHFLFSRTELNGLALVVLSFALIFSFTEWGVESFDFALGTKNYFIALIIVGTSVFAHHAAQRLLAISSGVKPEHKVWWLGLLLGLAAVLVSNGRVWVFAATSFLVHHVPGTRLGKPRHFITQAELGSIALAGPATNLVLAALTGLLATGEFASKFLTFNLVFAAYNLLPIPPLDGAHVFFASRLTYVFAFSALVGYALLALALNVHSIIGSLAFGLAGWLLFYVLFERFQ